MVRLTQPVGNEDRAQPCNKGLSEERANRRHGFTRLDDMITRNSRIECITRERFFVNTILRS